MEGSKIVKVLIVLFAVLTAMFYSLYYREEKQISVLSEEFVVQAAENLNSKGIEIDKSVIVREIPAQKIFVFTGNNGNSHEQIVIDAFSECFDTQLIPIKLNTPQGLSVALHDSANSEEQLGKLTFSDSDFNFVFSMQGSSISPGSSLVYNNSVKLDAKKSHLIDKVTGRLAADKSLGFTVTGSTTDGGYDIVSAVQTFNGIEMKGLYVNFVFENDLLIHAYGSCITEEPQPGYSEKLKDGINVLYELELNKVKRILDEKIVYSLRKGNENKYFILPCWEITFVDRSGNTVKEYFDAV